MNTLSKITGIYLGPAFGTFVGGLLIVHVGWRLLFIGFGAIISLLWLIPWKLGTRAVGQSAGRCECRGATLSRTIVEAAAMGCQYRPFLRELSLLPTTL